MTELRPTRRRCCDASRDAGIDYDDVFAVLEREGVQKFESSWDELIASVTDQLERAGADVDRTGSTTPAGQGPASADREESAR